MLIAQGEARLRSGDATGREQCAQAAAIARELGDAALLAGAGLAYGTVFFMGGVDPFLVNVLEEALSAHGRRGHRASGARHGPTRRGTAAVRPGNATA